MLSLSKKKKNKEKKNRKCLHLCSIECSLSLSCISIFHSTSVVEESFEYLDAPVERISAADVPMPYAANLERMAVPQVLFFPFLLFFWELLCKYLRKQKDRIKLMMYSWILEICSSYTIFFLFKSYVG